MDKIKQLTLPVKGLTCPYCATIIESNIKKLTGIQSVEVNLPFEQLTVQFSPTQASLEDIVERIEDAGFETGEHCETAAGAVDKSAKDSHSARQSARASIWRFTLHFLEMLLTMLAGMGLFHLLLRLIPASSRFATVFEPGTVIYTIAMAIFMTVPMLAWMVMRGHGWRYSLEMGAAMLAPGAVIILLCRLGVDEYLPWLLEAGSPAMYLGMIGYMLYRHNHFTVRISHSAHNLF